MKWSSLRARRRPSRSEGSAAAQRRPQWTRPVIQFVAAGLVALIVLIVGSGWLSKRAATAEAISDARSTTRLLATTVVQPALTRGLVKEQSASLDRFDRLALNRLIVGDVLRIKIWDAHGRIVYSDETRLIGRRFTLGSAELQVLEDGGTKAQVSDLTEPENQYEKDFGRLLEVYTQVWVPGGQRLLFEAYYSYDDVSRRSEQVLGAFRPITIAGLLIFVALTIPVVWVLARRLDASAADRERLLMAAVEASAGERRRIARDLHDGVVQDLAGISFGASATARELADTPRARPADRGARHQGPAEPAGSPLAAGRDLPSGPAYRGTGGCLGRPGGTCSCGRYPGQSWRSTTRPPSVRRPRRSPGGSPRKRSAMPFGTGDRRA